MSKRDLLIIIIGIIIVFGVLTLLTQKSSTPTPTITTNQVEETQLKIEDLTEGQGTEVKSGDTVTVHYTGTLTNGTKFDSSLDRGEPFTTQIGVGAVIKGWDQGIVGMKIGGKRRLTVPSSLAYGETGAADSIPPNATLIFEIELLDVK
jgi:FKBP-type peptidyl-prolyl cis-trans isomerase